MSAPFGIEARAERASISSGKSTLWASIRIDAKGKALEAERAPLAVALVIDVSGSMKGDPIAHVVQSCEIVAKLLGPGDRLAIVTFSDHAGVRCGLTALDDDGRTAIATALRDVVADGNTNMHAGMEAGAGLLVTAPTGLRRVMVVLSDGQPNRGLSTADQLGAYVQSLRPIGVSSLGFGIHHDENVLVAVATAGSGRYAYVPDPIAARVDLARAALAHGGIVADSLELRIKPGAGVELLQIVPATQLRHGGTGVAASIGDVFVDEGRLLAIELAIDTSKGQLAELVVEGRAPDGTRHEARATLTVDVHAGPHAIDRAAQRDILMVRAEAIRHEARAHADRGAMPAAAALVREMMKQIEASDGFARDDGSELAELREQLEDEAANYERKSDNVERAHQRKQALVYTAGTLRATKAVVPAPGELIGLSRDAMNRRFQIFTDTTIGRSAYNEIPLDDGSLSRKHARIMFVNDQFVLQDLGSTNGCEVNGNPLHHRAVNLVDGDIVKLGFVEFRFERQ